MTEFEVLLNLAHNLERSRAEAAVGGVVERDPPYG